MEADLHEFAPLEEELYVVSSMQQQCVLFFGRQLQSHGLKAMVL